MKNLFLIIALLLLAGCTASKKVAVKDAARVIDTEAPVKFHKPVNMKIAWYPYTTDSLVRHSDTIYLKEAEKAKQTGNVPLIVVTQEGSDEAVTIPMNIDNELLGRLIKHSVMTQMPIKRPFKEFIEQSNCASCHPKDIKINY